jgi:hypothetical protein
VIGWLRRCSARAAHGWDAYWRRRLDMPAESPAETTMVVIDSKTTRLAIADEVERILRRQAEEDAARAEGRAAAQEGRRARSR